MQQLFDCLDERVERIANSGRKGVLAALRDAQMIKTAYAYGTFSGAPPTCVPAFL
ncbi:hypothetical protein [Nocardia sp. NBC_01009]|uniref:hypothetical protein n=1 Tax=Nocardia sp. NBC_01009 TaxID=2975996 RepID=UPI0038663EA6|nr:hypothetical protein OHA42_24120 [Nocardia sp. NBC_01009]